MNDQSQPMRRRNVNKRAERKAADDSSSADPLSPDANQGSVPTPVVESFDSITLTLPDGSKEVITRGADGQSTTTIISASESSEMDKKTLEPSETPLPIIPSVSSSSPGLLDRMNQNPAGTYSIKAFRVPDSNPEP